MATTNLPYAVYTRTSTKGDADDNRRQSHSEQRDRAQKYAERHGLILLDDTFTDDHKSGGQMDDRPALEAAVRAVEEGQAGGIIVAFLDRLSRSSEQGQTFVRRLPEGAVVIAVDISMILTPKMAATDRLMFQVQLAVSEYVRGALAERVEYAKTRAIQAGVLVGPLLVGYRMAGHPTKPREEWTDAERQLVIHAPHAEALRELYRRRAEGAGYGELATWFDEQNVIPWRILEKAQAEAVEPNHRWSRQGIASLLKNEFYATGQIRYGDRLGPKVEPIIDRGLFALVEQVREANRNSEDGTRASYNRAESSPWLATGLLTCLSCGRKLQPWRGAKTQGAKRRYRCTNRACPSRQDRQRVSIDGLYIESVVIAEALKRGDKLVGTAPEAADLTELEAQAEKDDRLLAMVTGDNAARAIEELGDTYLSTVGALRKQRDASAAELARARSEAAASGVSTTYRLSQIWGDLSPAQQRTALAWYFETVQVGRPSVPGQGRGRKAPIPPEYREGDIVFVSRATRAWQPIEWTPITLVAEENA